jgi:hypothetical protein
MSRDVDDDARAIETAKRLDSTWAAIHAFEDELAERWGPMLTREVVAELERKMDADEDLSRDELEQWHVAVRMTRPTTTDEAVWDHWYGRPVSASLRTLAPAVGIRGRQPRLRGARPRGRRPRRNSRARSPGRRTSGSDDDPHEPDLEALDAVEGAFARVLGGDR